MASLTQVLQASVDFLRGRLPGLGSCDIYAGQLTGGETTVQVPISTPAVLTAFIGATREGAVETGEVDWLCRLAAYCITRHAAGRADRAVTALELAEQVLGHIDGRRFGLTGVRPARVTRVENLYSRAFDTAMVAVEAVTWEQTVRVGTDEWTAEGVRPESLYLGFAPEIGAGHEDDYIPVCRPPEPEEDP
jgi:hypothetical protein